MANAKIIELSEYDLIDIVDKYEYLSILLENKILPATKKLEELDEEKNNIDNLINELTTTKEFLQEISTQLTNETKQKIETYLNDKLVVILKDTFENNETLKSNISKITNNSIYFQKILEQDQKNLKTYKKMLGLKGLIFSSLTGILIGFFTATFFYKYYEITNRIENLPDLYKAINEKKVKTIFTEGKTVIIYNNEKIIEEGDFIDDIKVVRITNSSVTFYSFRDGMKDISLIN